MLQLVYDPAHSGSGAGVTAHDQQILRRLNAATELAKHPPASDWRVWPFLGGRDEDVPNTAQWVASLLQTYLPEVAADGGLGHLTPGRIQFLDELPLTGDRAFLQESTYKLLPLPLVHLGLPILLVRSKSTRHH